MYKKIKIITYPRTGSTYLFWLLSSAFSKEIEKFHLEELKKIFYNKENYINNDEYIITVLKDPVECISSFVTMESFYWRKNQNLDSYLDVKIKLRIEEYKEFFEKITHISNLMLNYNDINKHRDDIVNYISKQTKNKIVNNNYIDIVFDNKYHYFLRSSTTSNEYEYIKKKVLENDLSDCYNIYNNLLNKCINFN